jgi:chemotaxis protein methyltransferase CheR
VTVNPAARSGEVERFRDIIARRLGLLFEDAKLGFLAELLQRRAQARSNGCEAYLAGLENRPERDEWSVLAPEITVAETYFFRNIEQFRAFAEICLPERVRACAGARRLSLLSAGCASGEEAYTLAILAGEQLLTPTRDVAIVGVDVNAAALKRAARARFPAWSLRETPPEIRERWFHPEDKEFRLDERARDAVRFEMRNLAEDDPELWQPARYDAVFCRNVMMYFTPEQSRALIARIVRSLAPGGYLFLGHAETLRGLSQDFHLRHTHGTFYYQRKEVLEPQPGRRSAPAFPSTPDAAAPLASVVDDSASWVEAIRLASQRIEALAGSPAHAAAGSAPSPGPQPRPDLGSVLDLLRQERFGEALNRIRALVPDSSRDPDVFLLRAVLLAHHGQLSDAEQWCAKLLELDELNAGAHYVLALCREGVGDRKGAADHDQVAGYLDPAFAMPRLHLGLLARKSGDRDTARRELEQALVLLQREDASRLLLFGGGFSREALITLCRAELAAAGARA